MRIPWLGDYLGTSREGGKVGPLKTYFAHFRECLCRFYSFVIRERRPASKNNKLNFANGTMCKYVSLNSGLISKRKMGGNCFRGKRPSRFRAFRGFRGKRWFRPHGFRSFRPSWTYYPRTYFKRSVNNDDKRRGLYSYVTSNDDRRGLYNYYPRYYDKRRGLYSYQYR